MIHIKMQCTRCMVCECDHMHAGCSSCNTFSSSSAVFHSCWLPSSRCSAAGVSQAFVTHSCSRRLGGQTPSHSFMMQLHPSQRDSISMTSNRSVSHQLLSLQSISTNSHRRCCHPLAPIAGHTSKSSAHEQVTVLLHDGCQPD